MTSERDLRFIRQAEASVAAAFGRKVPEVAEVRETRGPGAEMLELLEEFTELRQSRRGESAEVARNAAAVKRAMMSRPVTERGRLAYAVDRLDRLEELRETVAALRAEVPLSGASAGQSTPRTRPAARPVTEAEVAENVARAFGRTTKGDHQ